LALSDACIFIVVVKKTFRCANVFFYNHLCRNSVVQNIIMESGTNSTTGYGYYTKTGLTVNTIKNGLPQIREAVSVNAGSLECFDFVNLIGIRINDVDTASDARIK
jgi:hypothetical protein